MKRFLLGFALTISTLTQIVAAPRDIHEAQQLAEQFIVTQTITQSDGAMRVAQNRDLRLAHTSPGEQPAYYIFNRGTGGGFVIVSGDDRTKQILGYSDTGSFDIEQAPVNLNQWLTTYEAEIAALDQLTNDTPIAKSNSDKVRKPTLNRAATATSIAPLLGDTQWGQGSPYNNLCPKLGAQHTVVGCVATALAQIMYYHKWPEKGKCGILGYTTKTNKLSVSFVNMLNMTYNWDNMLPSYTNGKGTTAQKNEVAKLSHHIGAALKMDYTLNASGAFSHDAPKALSTNFDYDPNMRLLLRDYHTQSEWEDIIRSELNAGRPVYYGGVGKVGGHAFVCDGYDANGLYHFNWGWNGTSDGYFELSALNPSTLGTGGGSGGFNQAQDIIVGIQKPTSSSKASYIIAFDGFITPKVTKIGRSDKFGLETNMLYNAGTNTFDGTIGIGLYQNEKLLRLVDQFQTGTLEPFYGYSNLDFIDLQIHEGVAAGAYKLRIVHKGAGQNIWTPAQTIAGQPSSINLTIDKDSITFSEPTDELPQLELVSIDTHGELIKDEEKTISYTIKNTGGEYGSALALVFKNKTNGFTSVRTINKSVIASGATKTFDIDDKINLNLGKYTLSVGYDAANSYEIPEAVSNFNYITFDNGIDVEILEVASAIETSQIDQQCFTQVGNQIRFDQARECSVIDCTGQIVYSGKAEIVDLPQTKGLYIVRIEKKSYKVMSR